IIDEEQIEHEIMELKDENVDLIIACIHFGEEYQREPNEYQIRLVDKLFALGTDVILGNHAHVIQPMEKRNIEGTENTGFVIYSLGNFISNQRWRYSDSGLILNFYLEKNFETGKTELIDVDYVPTWVHTYTKSGRIHYRVLPVYEAVYNYEHDLDPLVSTEDYNRLREVWTETTVHVDLPEMNILPVTKLPVS
ncbi:MAG TPA: CapA family protein, partial [Clostridia bacterium]|nr:CapA family protein [Clostridia bacterium]